MTVVPPISKKRLKEASERAKKVQHGEKVDRVPNLIWSNGAPAKFFGYTIKQIMDDFKLSAELALSAYEAWGWDVPPFLMGEAFLNIGSQDIGAKLSFPEDNFSLLMEPACKTAEDVEKYEIPDIEEMRKRGVMDRQFEAYNHVRKKYDFEPPWLPTTCATPTIAGNFVSHENILKWMATDPTLAKKVNKIYTEIQSMRMKYTIEEINPTRPALYFVTDFADEVMSPKHWEEYVLPVYNEWAKVAKENGCGIMYHLCGDHRLVFKEGLVDKLRNVGLLHVASEVDIKDVVERFGDKYLIAGNMSIESYRFGTPMDAYNEAKRQVEIGKECEKGFWLLVECDYAVDTPPGHAYAISKAVLDHGRFE